MAAPTSTAGPMFILANGGPFSNRASLVNFSSSPSGSWFSSRSALAAAASGPVGKARALQGPQRADIRSRAHGPNCAVACTSPEATRTSGSRRMIWYYAVSATGSQRNGSPDRHTLCRITDSFRASATRALPGPARSAIARAQSFRCSARFTRWRITMAASYMSVRAKASPHPEMRPLRSISPDW